MASQRRPATPGLEIRPNRCGRGWEITHTASGTYLATFYAKSRAVAALADLAAHDWTRPAELIRKDAKAIAAVKVIGAREMLIKHPGDALWQDALNRALAAS